MAGIVVGRIVVFVLFNRWQTTGLRRIAHQRKGQNRNGDGAKCRHIECRFPVVEPRHTEQEQQRRNTAADIMGAVPDVWNCAHNVGGGIPPLLFLLGMAWFNDWKAALYMPAFGAIAIAILAFALMRDTPQSCGLPPIEEYKNDYPPDYDASHEEELTAKQIFMKYVLPNKLLWYIALANVSVAGHRIAAYHASAQRPESQWRWRQTPAYRVPLSSR